MVPFEASTRLKGCLAVGCGVEGTLEEGYREALPARVTAACAGGVT
jgi:hypothetical protein